MHQTILTCSLRLRAENLQVLCLVASFQQRGLEDLYKELKKKKSGLRLLVLLSAILPNTVLLTFYYIHVYYIFVFIDIICTKLDIVDYPHLLHKGRFPYENIELNS